MVLGVLFLLAAGCRTSTDARPAEGAGTDPEELPSRFSEARDVDEYTNPWEYRWGDSPRDASGAFLWAKPGDAAEAWRVLPALGTPPDREGRRFLWLHTRLPSDLVPDPTLYLRSVDLIFSAYVDGRPIYNFGHFEGPKALSFPGYRGHFLPLGDGSAGKTLSLRIYSDHYAIRVVGQPMIGRHEALAKQIVRDDLPAIVMSVILIAIGIFMVALSVHRRADPMYWSYGGFALSSGTYFACICRVRDFILDAPWSFTFVEFSALFWIPVFFLTYFELIYGRGLLGLVPWLRRAHLVYALGATVVGMTGRVSLVDMLLPFQLLLLVALACVSLTTILKSWRGHTDEKIFSVGLTAASSTCAYDVLRSMGIAPQAVPNISFYGVFALTLALGGIVGRRFLWVQMRAVHLELQSAQQKTRIDEQGALLAAAARMASGDLEARIEADGSSEFATLARALDSMRSDVRAKIHMLESKHAEVNLLNEELRRKIEERSMSVLAAVLGGGSDVAPSRLAVGAVLGGRYRIVSILGEGAMGVVYDVERSADGRRFAAKVLGKQGDRMAVARFAREAQILSKLDHPNLVSIHDVDVTQSGLIYIIMELASGATLLRYQSRFGVVSWGLSVLRQIAGALSVIHPCGIIHRDLKLSNVLVTEDEDGVPRVKLVDFGISVLVDDDDDPTLVAMEVRRRSRASRPDEDEEESVALKKPIRRGAELTSTHAIVGTPYYMAPELGRGSRYARTSSDIFSLGVIAYEILTQQRPFSTPIIYSVAEGLPVEAPLALREVDDLDGDLVALFERCLHQDPTRRPTAADVLATLKGRG